MFDICNEKNVAARDFGEQNIYSCDRDLNLPYRASFFGGNSELKICDSHHLEPT